MTIDFTDIIIAVIGVIMSFVANYIVPPAVAWLKEKRLYGAAATVVAAARTYYKDNNGDEKLKYCIGVLTKKYGKWFDANEIMDAIQAAYVDRKAQLGETPSPMGGEKTTAES